MSKMSELNTRILLSTDKELLLNFELQRLSSQIEDEMEREMNSWSARWRGEALDHYLPMGWSFGCFKNDSLEGFVLAQPLVFFRGLTQTLWVEHLAFVSEAAGHSLVDTVYRWARDKHLQCVLLEQTPATGFVLDQWPQSRAAGQPLIEIKSARYE